MSSGIPHVQGYCSPPSLPHPLPPLWSEPPPCLKLAALLTRARPNRGFTLVWGQGVCTLPSPRICPQTCGGATAAAR